MNQGDRGIETGEVERKRKKWNKGPEKPEEREIGRVGGRDLERGTQVGGRQRKEIGAETQKRGTGKKDRGVCVWRGTETQKEACTERGWGGGDGRCCDWGGQ